MIKELILNLGEALEIYNVITTSIVVNTLDLNIEFAHDGAHLLCRFLFIHKVLGCSKVNTTIYTTHFLGVHVIYDAKLAVDRLTLVAVNRLSRDIFADRARKLTKELAQDLDW